MLSIIYFKEGFWKRVWAFVRFGVTINHVGVLIKDNRYIHLSYSGVKVSKLRNKNHIVYNPVGYTSIPVELRELQTLVVKQHFVDGRFKHIKLSKHRLILPFLPNPTKNHMLCNEFVDWLIKKYMYVDVDSLKIARKLA